MKFGAYLSAQVVEEWRDAYLDYKSLKTMIKALAEVETAQVMDVGRTGYGERVTSLSAAPNQESQGKFEGKDITEADFFAALEAEMTKIDAFTHKQLSEIKQQTDDLEAKVGLGSSKAHELTAAEREAAVKDAKALGDRFLRIEKFANLNFLGFHKILKKHDKQLPTVPCRRFYLTRLHNQRWVRHDYSKVFVDLSKIHALLRGDKAGVNEGTTAQNFVRTTTKYWVRTEDISKVKHVVLQHLPVFQHNLDDLQGDSQFCSSVYFDNTQLELYHGRLDKTPSAIAVRFRWYATPEPELVFVERKTHHDSWTGEASVKERFTLKEYQVMPFLRGEFTVEDKMAEMDKKKAAQADKDNVRRLFTEIYQQIDSKQLRPTMRTQYNRVAYQIPFDATVRVSLDTNLTMIAENPKVGPDCATEKRWYRNPKLVLPPTEFTVFPHSVLELKLSLKEGDEAPQWVIDLTNSGLCTQVHKFSKFVHGCATMLSEDVQAVPYWVDDESIRPSMLRSQPIQKRRSMMEPAGGAGAGSPATLGSPTLAFGTNEPIQLMQRKPSLVGSPGGGPLSPAEASAAAMGGYGGGGGYGSGSGHGGSGNGGGNGGYGAVPDVHTSLTQEFPILVEQHDSFVAWLCSPLSRCLFGSRRHAGAHGSGDGYKPRKVPMKIEPKLFLASERTLLNWFSMATTLGSISAALLGFSGGGAEAGADGAAGAGAGRKVKAETLDERGARLVGLLLLPVAVVFCGYALATYYWRSKHIAMRQGDFHDEVGPFLLGGVLMLALSAIFVIYLLEGTAIHI